jgi:hypothetical protein
MAGMFIVRVGESTIIIHPAFTETGFGVLESSFAGFEYPNYPLPSSWVEARELRNMVPVHEA